MQHGVGRATHGDVEGHSVLKGLTGGDRTRQDALVLIVVVAPGDLDDGSSRVLVELLASSVGGKRGAVAGQGQAKGLGQAVHGVGGEHP